MQTIETFEIRPARSRARVSLARYSFSFVGLGLFGMAGAALYPMTAHQSEIAPAAIEAPAPAVTAPVVSFQEASAAAETRVEAQGWRDAPVVTRGADMTSAAYARAHSNVALQGEGAAWWNEAAERYQRTERPQTGAVMAMDGGHVAIVSRIVSAREILVDHADWMNEGEVQRGALVRDVSENNDWSEVVVWNAPAGELGAHAYAVEGFITATPLSTL
ncbi:MAG: CHAP domain-containing protein [Hyphomonadaceae bacterium]